MYSQKYIIGIVILQLKIRFDGTNRKEIDYMVKIEHFTKALPMFLFIILFRVRAVPAESFFTMLHLHLVVQKWIFLTLLTC